MRVTRGVDRKVFAGFKRDDHEVAKKIENFTPVITLFFNGPVEKASSRRGAA